MSWNALLAGSVAQRLLVAGLVVIACVVSWAFAELSLRVYYLWTYSETLEDLAAHQTPPAKGAVVSLGHMLRPSTYERIIFELKPDLDVMYMGTHVRTNAQGWRDESYDLAKPSGTVRIAGIGDSVMFGWGVRNDQRYTNLLEDELNLRYPDRRWEVMNFGVPGYNLAMELEVLRRYALAYDPDMVLYGFVANDACLPNFVSGKLDVFSTTSFVRHYVKGLANYSLPLISRDEVVDTARAGGRPWVRYCTPSSVRPAYRDLVGWESFREALAELVELGDRRGMPVVFLSHFASGEMPALRGLEGLVVADVRLSAANRLGAGFEESPKPGQPRVSKGDPHPSAEGHVVIAREIFRTLEERGVWARVAAGVRRPSARSP